MHDPEVFYHIEVKVKMKEYPNDTVHNIFSPSKKKGIAPTTINNNILLNEKFSRLVNYPVYMEEWMLVKSKSLLNQPINFCLLED